MIMWTKWLFILLCLINTVILIWLSVNQYKKGDRKNGTYQLFTEEEFNEQFETL